jgi:phytoene/squalene synthetase
VTDIWNADLQDLSELQLREIADQLAARGDADDAARETEELLVMLRQWKIRADVRITRLADLWHAVSRDSSDTHIRHELAKYRGEKGTP